MILNRFELATVEQKDYPVDYTRWLFTGQTIVSAVLTVTPVTAPAFPASAAINTAATGLIVTAGLGGIDQTEYTVDILATMSNGEIKRDSLVFTIEDAIT